MELGPSEVRQRVLRDHRELRGLLDRLEVLARRVLQGHRRVEDELREQALVLDKRLRTHMALEEEILVPLLRDADPWGRERVERFHAEHRRQREIMDGMWVAGPGAGRTVFEFALISWGFASLLRDDMAEEERISLNEAVLRDDLIKP